MIPEFVLLRISERLHATYGVLMENNEPWLLTLEDPWLQNQPFISCIPPGPYVCERIQSPKHGETFRVINVKDRKYINFHSGNDPDDTEGCILIGLEWDRSGDYSVILKSRFAMMRFMNRLHGVDKFNIYIRRAR